MVKTSVTIIAAVLLLGGFNVSAQEEVVAKDVLEIGIYGGLASPTGGISDWTTGAELGEVSPRAAETGWDVALDLGYFVTPTITAGLDFRYSQFGIDSDLAGDHVHRLFNPNLYVRYSFEGESNLVPFVKLHVGLENPKFSTWVYDENSMERKFRELSYDPALAYGLSAGVFYYTADYSGIFAEAGYHQAMTEDVEGTYQGQTYVFGENTGVFTVNVGVRLLVGSGD